MAPVNMLSRVRAGARDLEPDAAAAVSRFLAGQQVTTGGFLGRGAGADLYYTVFGIDCCLALGVPLAASAHLAFARSCLAATELDLIHLCCVIRALCRLAPGGTVVGPERDQLVARLQAFRTADGGFADTANAERGSVYAAFLAVHALAELEADLEGVVLAAASLRVFACEDGSYANVPDADRGSVPATAAAMVVLHRLGHPVGPATRRWLLAMHEPAGGFKVSPAAPIPDLLSTGTALFALRTAGAVPDALAESCDAFVGSCWQDDGGFSGHAADPTTDSEYTYYALLALGCLASVADGEGRDWP